MSESIVTFDVADRIATITVNRPDKLNAIDDAVMAALGEAIDQVRARDDVGGAIITGAGRAFVAGADIAQLPQKSAVEAYEMARRGQAIFRHIETLAKPVIAAVNGYALGGGCELAMACHVRLASEHAKFGQPEVKLGIIPGYGGTQRLPRLVGAGRALQLLLTGEVIDAAEAFRIGLVNAVVPAAELVDAARRMLGQMMANGPLALAHCIAAVHQGAGIPVDEALALEASAFGLLAASADMKEGTTAFLEKRAARFSGR
ncbi:MAG: enoyl-CoA hydratase/isomerase family protein [Gemmatimonadota bacterium]|nr:enoyl-CoA hydratase/isomerase family protein [Gemmatimonadota bacterium]